MTRASFRSQLIILFACLGMAVRGQEITFQASVDRTAIATGEQVQLTITLTNARGSIAPPAMEGLVVVQGPFSSSRMNIVNGRSSSSLTTRWVLTATKPGTYTIGPAQVRVGGGVLRTDPITIEVTKGAEQRADPQAARGQQRDVNLFATINLSKSSGYVGEQVIATYTLYSRYPNVDLAREDMPKTNGFWAEQVDLGERGWQDELEVINGLQYRVAVLKKQVLLPQRSGTLTIEPMELTCVVGRSFFDRGQEVPITSNSAVFKAKELPSPSPSGFNGTVGEVQFSMQADRTQTKANEAVEIKVRITGRSNLKLIDAPVLNFPPDIEAYDPKTSDKITVNGAGMSGTREFQYLIIPRYEGMYAIGPVTFAYFDPRTGEYRSVQSEAIDLQVLPGDGTTTGIPQRPGKVDLQILDTDIRYLRTGDLNLRPAGRFLFGSIPWMAGMAAPAIAFLVFWTIRRRRLSAQADVTGTRRRQADRVAGIRLKQAADALRNDDRDAFYSAIDQGLRGYFADKFGLSPAETIPAVVHDRLVAFADGAAIADDFAELVRTCDMARFAPVDAAPRNELLDKATGIITRTERILRA